MRSSISRATGQTEGGKQPLWQMRAMAIGMAVVANAVILGVARIVNGEFPAATMGDDDQTIGFVSVIVVTILAGLVAWGLLTLLERATARGVMIWLGIAVVVFLFSLSGPLASGTNTSSKVVLTLLHVSTFGAIVPAMWRSAQPRRA